MNYEHIIVSSTAHVTTICLNRPQSMNAINAAMHEELQAALDTFAADDDQFIGVITGAGQRAFCAGSDLKAIAEGGKHADYPKNGYAGLIERFDLNKPLIAWAVASKSPWPATSSSPRRRPALAYPSPGSGLWRWVAACTAWRGKSA
jgi:enoyl-CoA hydratase/carnithine racemase